MMSQIPTGYKQTDIGVIPSDWDVLELGKVIKFIGGSQPPKSTFVYKKGKGYIRLIQIRDYKSDKHITYIPQELAQKKCDELDVMIGRYGPPIFQILRGIAGAYNVALMKAEPNEQISREYMRHFLRQDWLFKFVEKLSQRSSGQTGVDIIALSDLRIGIPKDKKEQQAIATALSDIDTCISKLDALITKQQQIKKGTMQQLLTGKNRLPGFDGEWKNSMLGDLLTRLSNGLNPRKNFKLGEGSNYYVTIKNIKGTKLSLDESCAKVSDSALEIINKRSDLQIGDILFSSIGTRSNTYLIRSKPKNWNINESVFTMRPNEKITSELLQFYIGSKTFFDKLSNTATGSTFQSIKVGALKKSNIYYPVDQKEQQAIANVLSDIDTHIHNLQTKKKKYEKIKLGMMQKLLTGQIRLV